MEHDRCDIDGFMQEHGDVGMEFVLDIPVFMVKQGQQREVVLGLIQLFGENTVIRVVNSQFADVAIEFGTDKKGIDEHDFRGVVSGQSDGYAHDLWGVEEKALAMGLKREDVFCGTAYSWCVTHEQTYSPAGLGVPRDRFAILIFDASKIKRIEDTDGYVFIDSENKRQALLGVIKLEESYLDFEVRLNALESVSAKIDLIAEEVEAMDDLEKASYIALNIAKLFYAIESSSGVETSGNRDRLVRVVERLEYISKIIKTVLGIQSSVEMIRHYFAIKRYEIAARGGPTFIEGLQAKLANRRPDQLLRDISVYLEDADLRDADKQKLVILRGEILKCKREFGIGHASDVDDLRDGTSAGVANL